MEHYAYPLLCRQHVFPYFVAASGEALPACCHLLCAVRYTILRPETALQSFPYHTADTSGKYQVFTHNPEYL